MAAQAETHTLDLGGMRRLILAIVAFTVACQALTSMVLFGLLVNAGRSAGAAAWEGLFHGVAAFNNAGISIFPGGLTTFVGNGPILLTMAVAVIVGGLGFPVWFEVWRHPAPALALERPRQAHPARHRRAAGGGHRGDHGPGVEQPRDPRRAERPGPAGERRLRGGHAAHRRLQRPRLRQLQPGLPPLHRHADVRGRRQRFGGGGIKVTTFALLLLVVWAELRGDPEVNTFNRRIPLAAQRQALTLAVISVNAVVLGTLIVLATNDVGLSIALFEVMAAFTTAGLSTGITPDLNGAGQAVLMALMFLGRVGPLTLGVALVLRERERLYTNPEERPIVG